MRVEDDFGLLHAGVAYLVMGAVLGGYSLHLWIAQRRLERFIASLQEELRASEEASR